METSCLSVKVRRQNDKSLMQSKRLRPDITHARTGKSALTSDISRTCDNKVVMYLYRIYKNMSQQRMIFSPYLYKSIVRFTLRK